jgi:hypothetical protein
MLHKLCIGAKALFINPQLEREDVKKATLGKGGIYCWYCTITG